MALRSPLLPRLVSFIALFARIVDLPKRRIASALPSEAYTG